MWKSAHADFAIAVNELTCRLKRHFENCFEPITAVESEDRLTRLPVLPRVLPSQSGEIEGSGKKRGLKNKTPRGEAGAREEPPGGDLRSHGEAPH